MGEWFQDQALSGSLLLAVPVALVAGLVSFFSPCVIPLLPGYLSYATGLSGADLGADPSLGRRGRMLAGALLFVAAQRIGPADEPNQDLQYSYDRAFSLSLFLLGPPYFAWIALRHRGRKDHLPFGPFLAFGTLVVLLWGDVMLRWYRG